ncbi:MAG: thiamine-phosphate kinase [Chloroflexi bacterium]|nr:thiamine-phosphate kinase [Chloroflexota bacterium]
MKVSELGEFGLIGLIGRTVTAHSRTPSGLLIGIGDDAAAWRTGAPVQLATTDTMVDGVHFLKDKTGWDELGWKSLAVNLSDIAAMGGVPRYALVTLAIPGDTEGDDIVSLYKGMLDIAGSSGVTIAGGDTVSSPVIVITVSLSGEMPEDGDRIMTRSAARPGETIAVTGFLGSSAAGLRMVQQPLPMEGAAAAYLRQAHFKPQPRVAEGQEMARAGVRCAIDVSDGLIGDLTHICEMSRVGARIVSDRVPVHPFVKAAFPGEYLDLALSGGEDYELLFTAGETVLAQLRKAVHIPLTAIGEITGNHPGQVVLVDHEGKSVARSKTGWDHFHPG